MRILPPEIIIIYRRGDIYTIIGHSVKLILLPLHECLSPLISTSYEKEEQQNKQKMCLIGFFVSTAVIRIIGVGDDDDDDVR